MTSTITHASDTAHPIDPAADMLRTVLATVQPRDLDDLIDLAGLVGDLDGGHITATTIGDAR